MTRQEELDADFRQKKLTKAEYLQHQEAIETALARTRESIVLGTMIGSLIESLGGIQQALNDASFR